MHLKDFSLVSPAIQNGEVLKAIEAAISPETIEKVIVQSQAQENRTRSLPAHLVVCLVIAMSIWSTDEAARRTQEFSRWSGGSMGEGGKILASAM